LTWLFNLGLLVICFGCIYGLYLAARKWLYEEALAGLTSVMALVALSLDISIKALGLVGIYSGKVFNQVQNRPNYTVRDVHL
jgi:putative glycosyltransferase